MALTFGTTKRINIKDAGGWRFGIVDITLDGAYAAGGWEITAANLGISTLYLLIPASARSGYVLEWDQVNGKLKAYQEADGATAMGEIDAGDLDTVVVRCLYIGY